MNEKIEEILRDSGAEFAGYADSAIDELVERIHQAYREMMMKRWEEIPTISGETTELEKLWEGE